MVEGARPALPEDLAACARLLREARTRAESLRGGPELLASYLPASADIDDHWVGEELTGPGRVLLVGTIDGVVVGVGAGHVETGDRGAVDCCYVEEGARGVGVGTELASSLIRWLADAGCLTVDAPALPGDRTTKQLFEAQGLSARLLVLHRRLR